jgi:hypothetical protein
MWSCPVLGGLPGSGEEQEVMATKRKDGTTQKVWGGCHQGVYVGDNFSHWSQPL